jgi:hypothetical protein
MVITFNKEPLESRTSGAKDLVNLRPGWHDLRGCGKNSCFVSGHDFSRAVNDCEYVGL